MNPDKHCDITETVEMLEIIKGHIIKSYAHEEINTTIIEDCKPSSCEFVIDSAIRLINEYAGIMIF